MQIGYIGLGRMGANMVERLIEKGHSVLAYDESSEAVQAIAAKGAAPCYSIEELVSGLVAPRFIWIMVPHEAIDSVVRRLMPYLSPGDTVIDGGNSFYKDSTQRAQVLAEREIDFLDAGVSGGPAGARLGACVMVGGKKESFDKLEKLWADVAASGAYKYVGSSGAGHFVKMVHNGIEYGMMEALAEGFALLHSSSFKLHLEDVADIYNHRSVIESRLVGWLKDSLEEFGEDLKLVSGSVGQTGEGTWSVETAHELGVPVPIIEGSVNVRRESVATPTYTGKILSVLRNRFGKHDIQH